MRNRKLFAKIEQNLAISITSKSQKTTHHCGFLPFSRPTIKAIARDLHVSRKVIRKAIRAPEGAFD
nr:hypothetical protein [Sphingobium sp. SJ10-10]